MAIIKNTDPILSQDNFRGFYPDQFVSDKTKKSDWWIKTTMDYFGMVAYSHYLRNKEIRKNYRLMNGEFDFKDYVSMPEYQWVTQYLTGTPLETMEQDVPQHLSHYSILNAPINTLLGELSKRPFKWRVKALDEESTSEILNYRTGLLQEAVIGLALQRLQIPEDASPEELQQFEQMRQQKIQEIQKKINSYTTVAEQWGNKVMSAMKHYFNLRSKSEEGFRDFLITSQEFHHFYPTRSPMGFEYKLENPANVWYQANRNAFYTSDCFSVGTLEVLNLSEIMVRYDLTPEEINHLKEMTIESLNYANYTATSKALPNPLDPTWAAHLQMLDQVYDESLNYSYPVYQSQFNYIVCTAYWQSKKKIGLRKYLDENGFQQEEFVSEDYVMSPEHGDIDVEWTFDNQWYKGTKIGADVYHCVEPIDFFEGPPIVGILNTTRNTKSKSMLDLLKPYQFFYNIALNQIRELLEKEVGVVFLGDIRLVPKKDTDDPIETMLYQAKERGTIFVDTSPENTGGNVQFNQLTRVDLTRSAEITQRIQFAQVIKHEAMELVGITRQRTGSVMATETATATNTSLSQSYAQTEPLFSWHDRLMQKVYQTILNMVQYTELQKPESIVNLLNSELDNVFFKINKDELLRNLFVFVTSYAEDREILEQLKQLAQPAIQNGADLAEIAEIFSAQSERKLKEILNDIKERRRQEADRQYQLEQDKLQQNQEQFAAEVERQERIRQEEMQNENINKQLDRENKIQIETLRQIGLEGSYSQEEDLTGQLTEYAELSMERSSKAFEKNVKLRELEQRDRELDLKDKDIEAKKYIAKENKTKAELTRKNTKNKKK